MKITVKLFALLEDYLPAGAKDNEVALEVADGTTAAAIVKQLNLLRPIYAKTTNYGHFGKDDADLTWETTDKVAALKRAVK